MKKDEERVTFMQSLSAGATLGLFGVVIGMGIAIGTRIWDSIEDRF